MSFEPNRAGDVPALFLRAVMLRRIVLALCACG